MYKFEIPIIKIKKTGARL